MTIIGNLLQNLPIPAFLVNFIGIVFILILAFLSIKIINYILKKTCNELELEVTAIQVLQQLFKYLIIIIAFVLVLNELGINVRGFVLSLGIGGIAVGFAARDTLSNFISGLFIVGSKSFEVGDIIEVSGYSGTVTNMGFRMMTLTTVDNKVLNVPNSLFSTEVYLNYTAQDRKMVELPITIPLDADLDMVIESMEKKASSLKWVLTEPKPNVVIKEITELGFKTTVNVWTKDPWIVSKRMTELARELKEVMV